MVKPTNTKAIEDATGTPWDHWCALLKESGADDLDHNGIVKKARALKPISGWWAQSVAVAYEQHINRRKPGQMSDGSFSASRSRTLRGSPAEIQTQLNAFTQTRQSIGPYIIAETPTTSQTAKWHYWRCKFSDGSTVSIALEAKGPDKTRLAIEHKNLSAQDQIAISKAAWADLLTDCFTSKA